MTYTDRVWTTEARAELQEKIERLSAESLRKLLITVLSEPEPANLIATLRGAAFGLAARQERAKIDDNLPADPIERDIELGHRLLHSLYDNGDLSVDHYDGIGRALFCLSGLVKVERAARERAENEVEGQLELSSRIIELSKAESEELRRMLAKMERVRDEAVAFEEDYKARLDAAEERERALQQITREMLSEFSSEMRYIPHDQEQRWRRAAGLSEIKE